MIEPEHAGRLGFCVRFAPGDRDAVETTRRRLRELGVGHVRLNVGPQETADVAWLGWLLAALAEELEVLPCVADMATYARADGVLCRLLERHGRHFATVEVLDRAGEPARSAASALLTAVETVRQWGKASVIGLDFSCPPERLAMFGADGLLDLASAVGLHTRPSLMPPALDAVIDAVSVAARRFNPHIGVWLADVGRSTWRHEAARQAQLFLDALGSEADRIYWRDLCDDTAVDVRDPAAHCGIDNAAGQPKLLGRMLSGGVAEVERTLALVRKVPAPAVIGCKPVLVTGGAGFIGANLADRLAGDGHQVLIFDALARPGVERNLRWLARRHPAKVSFVLGDLRDEDAAGEAAANAGAVFHLAGQVAVTTSMVNPLADFAVNAGGTLALLDALRRRNPAAPLIFASTNKVYGDLADIELVQEEDRYLPKRTELRAHGVSEARPLCFHTPYGCSKGAADQYVLDYAHSFGLRTAVLRMSCIYGERQLGTEDQGWVAHFLLRAIAGNKLTIYGDGRQVRDVLHVGDAVAAYVAAWKSIDAVTGRAYNLGGGPANAISLLQLVEHIETLLGRSVDVEFSAWRPGDQRYFVADTSRIRRDLSLPAPMGWRAGLVRLAEHFGATIASPAPATVAAL